MCSVHASRERTDLASVVVNDEALIPAVEVLVSVDLHAELLQHSLVRPFANRVHGGTDVVQDAHNAGRILGSQGKTLFYHIPNHESYIWYELFFG